MRLSEPELSRICERASNLSERLSGQYVPTGGDGTIAACRLERWQRLSKNGEQRQLAALLGLASTDRLSHGDLLALLGPMKRATFAPLPAWTILLDDIVEHLTRDFGSAEAMARLDDYSVSKRLSFPFEHLYRPIAEFAWGRLTKITADPAIPIGPRAKRSLRRYLVYRLSGIASTQLHTAFLAHRAIEQSGMFSQLAGKSKQESEHTSDRRFYASFVAQQGNDGLRAFFLRNPVAARLIAEVTAFWIDFVGEFLARLQNDEAELAARFNNGRPLGLLHGVKAGVSDPHRGGRTVLLLRFARGLRLVYKPRPLGIDRVFYELVERINRERASPSLRALKVSEQGEYGWMEYAQASPCPDRAAAKRYYRRAGALVGLIHWLDGIDFHRENVVAAGEQPTLVDLESLAHPLRKEELASIQTDPRTALGLSIMRSGMLPLRQLRGQEQATFNSCGIDGPVRQASLLPAIRWRDINTDRMSWRFRTWHHVHKAHRPTIGRRLLSLREFEKETLAGYQAMVRFLARASEHGVEADRGKALLTERRYIKRPTLIYALLIRRSLETAAGMEGIDRSIELLSLPCQPGEEKEWLAEISSLERLDVPYFQLGSPSAEGAPEQDASFVWPGCFEPDTRTFRLSVRRKIQLENGLICRRPGRRPNL